MTTRHQLGEIHVRNKPNVSCFSFVPIIMESGQRILDSYAIFSPVCKPVPLSRHTCQLPQPFPDMIAVFTLSSKSAKKDQKLKVVIVNKDNKAEHLHIGTISQHERAICWQPCHSKGFIIPNGHHSYQLHVGTDAELSKFLSTIRKTRHARTEEEGEESVTECSQTESQEITTCDTLPEADRASVPASPVMEKLQEKLPPNEITPQLQVQGTPSRAPYLTHSASKKRKANSAENDAATPSSTRKRQSSRQRPSPTSSSPLSSRIENTGKKNHINSKQTTSLKKDSMDSEPSARWGHTLSDVGNKRSLLIGGQGHGQVISRDSIWILNTETGDWNSPPTIASSNKLPSRMGHTATFDPQVKCVYVYGGSKNLRWFNDIHVLDLETWRWSHIEASGVAPTRAYHSSTIFRNELYIFGGVFPNPDPQPDGCSNDVFIYSPESESWYRPVTMGVKPKPRSGHSATLLSDQLVIFGGWDAPVCFNDLHILDLCLMEFTSPKVTGKPPSPRCWHASIALPGNRVLIHGGYNGNQALADAFIFNLDSYMWTQIDLQSSVPIGVRAGHAIIHFHGNQTTKDEKENTPHENSLALFGGGDNEDNFFGDFIPFSLT